MGRVGLSNWAEHCFAADAENVGACRRPPFRMRGVNRTALNAAMTPRRSRFVKLVVMMRHGRHIARRRQDSNDRGGAGAPALQV